MSVRAQVNPDIFVWARQTAGYSLEEAAKKIGVSHEKLQAWESGEDKPTLRQLRETGRVYHRPSALFYRYTTPNPPQTIPDFRLTEGNLELTPDLRFEIRRAFERRTIALELTEQLREQPPQVNFTAETSEPPEDLAARIREWLGVTIKTQYAWTDHYQALRAWIAALEKVGVLVFQTAGVDIDQMRGFSISERPFPVVAVNGKDSPRGRIFTLFHELVHVALRKGGICDLHDYDLDSDSAIEAYCNRVAGEVLVPKGELLAEPNVRVHQPGVWNDLEIGQLANRYMVSQEVILRRLLIVGKTTEEYYRERRFEFIKAYQRQQAQGRGFVPYYRRILKANGSAYTNLVLSAYYSDEITSRDLSNFLGGIKLTHIPDIEYALTGYLQRGDDF